MKGANESPSSGDELGPEGACQISIKRPTPAAKYLPDGENDRADIGTLKEK